MYIGADLWRITHRLKELTADKLFDVMKYDVYDYRTSSDTKKGISNYVSPNLPFIVTASCLHSPKYCEINVNLVVNDVLYGYIVVSEPTLAEAIGAVLDQIDQRLAKLEEKE